MGYPALWFMAYLSVVGKDFVIRTSEALLNEVQEAIHAPQPDLVIQAPLQKPGRPLSPQLQALVPDSDPAMVLSIRVLKLQLENGTQEILLTPLLDAERFPEADFQGLYAKRWGSETNDDVIKNILEIETFSGKSSLSVTAVAMATGFSPQQLARHFRQATGVSPGAYRRQRQQGPSRVSGPAA